MVRRFLHIILLLLACALPAGAFTDTMEGSKSSRLRSLQIHPERDPAGAPVIVLGTPDRLVVSFDILSTDRDYLRYELIHCNADWQPSSLVDSEFLDGFNQATIDDYDFSRMTTTQYVNYRLTIPNSEMRPLISGNYLLRIYPEQDPEQTLAQCRFMVSEQSAGIDATLTTRTDIDYNRSHQQLALTIDTDRAAVTDPFNDLKVVVQQNGRYDNEVMISKPLRMQGRNLSVYEHLAPLIFPAGNEYRRFETVSVTYPGMGVESIEYHEPYYHFTLYPDSPRSAEPYSYDQTQHGRFTIREYNSTESDLEADYVVVHFALEMPRQPEWEIYIDGDLTSRRFDPESRMVYNPDTGRYERSMLLKQGAYNYQYLAVPVGNHHGLTAPIEGDKYQTVNEYTIKVYTRRPGDRYDRLIGVMRLSSQ